MASIVAKVVLPLTIKCRRFIAVRSSGNVIKVIHEEKLSPVDKLRWDEVECG
jgi:hypothetical protein